MTKMFFPLAVLSALTLSAQDMDEEMSLDEDGKGVSLFAEAEDFRLADGWQACEAPQYAERGKVGHLWPWYKDIKKAPHLASALKYAAGDAGAATHTFDLPHNGVWRVWVRQGRKGAVAVNGRKLEGMRPEPGDWGWAMRDVEAKKGPFEVKLTAAEKGAAADCVVVTDDRKYEPDIRDFRKFFLRIRYDRKNASPALFPGGWHQPDYATLKPGESTDWIDVSKRFVYGVTEGIVVTAKPKKATDETHFEVDFSWNGEKVVSTFRHHGKGAVVRGLVSTARRGIMSDVEMSAADLQRARDVSSEHARMPKRFGVSSTMALDYKNWSPEAVENEMEVFRILGMNGVGNKAMERVYAPNVATTPEYQENGEFVWDMNRGCICSPDREALAKVAKKIATANADILAAGKKVPWGIMDEVLWGMNKVLECKSKEKICTERFREYLQAKGVKPSDFGATDWSEVSPVKDYKAGLRYYWTARYRDHVVGEFFRTVTEIAAKENANILPTANMGIELVYEGNFLKGGMNLFHHCNSGAMKHILTEDWANEQRTYQHCSYQCDVLRAAGRRKGVAASMLNIISARSAEEIAAKAFSEAGRGVKAIGFFRYGPDYTGASDSSNRDPGIYRGIRAFCDALAPVEDYLMDGQPLKGDAALLLSETGEIWQLLAGKNEFGKDRMALSLLLNHLGVRTDVLNEDDVLDRLGEYRQLFVCDRNIRRVCVKPLCDWLKAGGTLIVGKDALSADEANAPIDFSEFEKSGKVLRIGFSSMKDYVLAAQQDGKAIYSKRVWPEEPRRQLAEVVKAAGIVPAVKTSDPLVEAQVVVSPHGRLLVVSNWRCEPTRVTVTGTVLKRPIGLDIVYGCCQPLD